MPVFLESRGEFSPFPFAQIASTAGDCGYIHDVASVGGIYSLVQKEQTISDDCV